MEDEKIIELYWARSEQALAESQRKYGLYCTSIARNILKNDSDSEECVNDTWLRAWESIPPQRPRLLRAYLGRITRNLSLTRFERNNAQKRGGGVPAEALEELERCLPATGTGDRTVDDTALTAFLNRFLRELPRDKRVIFLRRYWYLCSEREIANGLGVSVGSVKATLHRTRKKLKKELEKEGIVLWKAEES